MRAIGDPDVFLPTDLAVRRGARALGLPDAAKTLAAHAERWRPWRSYALIRLWRASAPGFIHRRPESSSPPADPGQA
jgi:AraC family transcriptional regulator of adaptative response / DNA-3-methyladenine glycosylase II